MADLENWKTQIKKGYLELCLLLLIQRHKKLYGLEILDLLEKQDLHLKEGTLYPILSRMTIEGWLTSHWVTENSKGHPRKFYSLTRQGAGLLEEMKSEFGEMAKILKNLDN